VKDLAYFFIDSYILIKQTDRFHHMKVALCQLTVAIVLDREFS